MNLFLPPPSKWRDFYIHDQLSFAQMDMYDEYLLGTANLQCIQVWKLDTHVLLLCNKPTTK